ncbi:uncharacterized protein LOC103396821 isoform X2 [Cynoglossus semilaevis]|nr:uncharacterized protein LOC103396821 isoform X2 [Cynoglossus semilaevis]
MTGQDLRLNVTAPVVLSRRDLFRWTFNRTYFIVTIFDDNDTEQGDSYTDRAFISAENKSLLLKNTQNNDSGLYRAELQTRRKIKCLVQYQVMVQDMVSRPNLVVTRVSSSSAHCDLNVTCSTADSELITNSVSCNSSDCSLQETETSRDTVSGAVLSLFLSHDNLVVCQLSNNVSQRRITEEILQLCFTDSGSRFFIIIGSVVGVTVVICLVVIFILFYRKHRPATATAGNTIYEVPQIFQSPISSRPENPKELDTVYATAEWPKEAATPTVETLYGKVTSYRRVD